MTPMSAGGLFGNPVHGSAGLLFEGELSAFDGGAVLVVQPPSSEGDWLFYSQYLDVTLVSEGVRLIV